MNFTKPGIILFTQKYEECVDFYGRVLELEFLHKIDRPGEQLTTFSLGDTYLMVESGGVAYDGVKPVENSPVILRFNVADVMATGNELRSRGVAVNVTVHKWGTTAGFSDPDGNRCALRSNDGFGD